MLKSIKYLVCVLLCISISTFVNGQKRVYGIKNTGGIGLGSIFSMNDTGGDFQEIKVFKPNSNYRSPELFIRKTDEVIGINYDGQALLKLDTNKKDLVKLGSLGTYSNNGVKGITNDKNYLFGIDALGKFNKGAIFRYNLDSLKIEYVYDFSDTFEIVGTNQLTVYSDSVLIGITRYSSRSGANAYEGCLFTFNIYTKTYNRLMYFTNTGPTSYLKGNILFAAMDNIYLIYGNRFIKFNYRTSTVEKYFLMDSLNYGLNNGRKVLKHSNGNYYWVMKKWGPLKGGTILEYNMKLDSLIVFVSFHRDSSVVGPLDGLTEYLDHNIYGFTSSSKGYMFKCDMNTRKASSIWSINSTLTGTYADYAGVMNSSGRFYLSTRQGGYGGNGILHSYNPANKEFIRWYDYLYPNEGKNPKGKLTLAYDGYLYGTCQNGGPNDNGTLFKIHPKTYEFVKLAEFDSMPFIQPQGYLCLNNNGNLYDISTKLKTDNYSNNVYEFDVTKQRFGRNFAFSSNFKHWGPMISAGLNRLLLRGAPPFVLGELNTENSQFKPHNLSKFTTISINSNFVNTGNNMLWSYSDGKYSPGLCYGFYSLDYGTMTPKCEVSFNSLDSIQDVTSYITYADSALYLRCWTIDGGEIISYDLRTKKLKTLGLKTKLERIPNDNGTLAIESGFLFGISNGVQGGIWKYNLKSGVFTACAPSSPNYGQISYSDLVYYDTLVVPTLSRKTYNFNAVQIFPNPGNGNIFVNTSDDQKYQIFDLSGRLILSGNTEANNKEIILNGIRKGMYLIRFENAEKQVHTVKYSLE